MCLSFPVIFSIPLRFIYVRYASGLLKEGLMLLHSLVFIYISLSFVNGFGSWVGRAWWQETNYLDIVKGKICNKVFLCKCDSIFKICSVHHMSVVVVKICERLF